MIHETQELDPTNPSMSLGRAGKELGAAIIATAEYRAFVEAKRRYEDDTQARELLGRYQESQRMAQLMRQLASDTTQEAQSLAELKQTIEANHTLMDYFDAQEKLIALLRALNEFISERLNLKFAELTKPKTGCCG